MLVFYAWLNFLDSRGFQKLFVIIFAIALNFVWLRSLWPLTDCRYFILRSNYTHLMSNYIGQNSIIKLKTVASLFVSFHHLKIVFCVIKSQNEITKLVLSFRKKNQIILKSFKVDIMSRYVTDITERNSHNTNEETTRRWRCENGSRFTGANNKNIVIFTEAFDWFCF